MHDNDPRSLLRWELRQRSESGYVTADVAEGVNRALASGTTTDDELTELYDELIGTARRSDWTYDEPDDLDSILATAVPGGELSVDAGQLEDRLLGAWHGRCAGCILGKPVELGDYWTPEHLRNYLEVADAWPLDNFIPALDPMPAGFELRECWPTTTRGNIVASARDDDVDYSILALHILETYGRGFAAADVAHEWLGRLPFLETYTAERTTYRNLVADHSPAVAGEIRNPYREWIGAQIRADVFGYVNPGEPRAAASLAYQDAVLSHRGNGIYGAMWAAALVAAALGTDSPRVAIDESLRLVPPKSRLHEALSGVISLYDEGHSWESARSAIEDRLGHYEWVHTVSNAALVVAGLLWGEGDFTQTITLTVLGGWDTDSNGATAGSVAGALVGFANIPSRWTVPLNDTVRSSIVGFDDVRISELAARTHRLVRVSAPADVEPSKIRRSQR